MCKNKLQNKRRTKYIYIYIYIYIYVIMVTLLWIIYESI